MTEDNSPRPPDLACERAGLLLSLRNDAAATPDQLRELDEHLVACAACRRTVGVDGAVGERLRERAAGAVPDGFAVRVVAAAIAERAAAAAQNRFLRRIAAAAVFVLAVAGGSTFLRGGRPNGDGTGVASARDISRIAVIHPRSEGR